MKEKKLILKFFGGGEEHSYWEYNYVLLIFKHKEFFPISNFSFDGLFKYLKENRNKIHQHLQLEIIPLYCTGIYSKIDIEELIHSIVNGKNKFYDKIYELEDKESVNLLLNDSDFLSKIIVYEKG